MANLFHLEVLTPFRQFFSEKVEAFVATASDGEIGVFAGHSPFTAPLVTCVLRIKNKDGVWKNAAVTEGMIEVTPDGALVLTTAAEWPEEIDRERVEESKKRAEERLGEDMLKFESSRARSSLTRAQNRLKALDS